MLGTGTSQAASASGLSTSSKGVMTAGSVGTWKRSWMDAMVVVRNVEGCRYVGVCNGRFVVVVLGVGPNRVNKQQWSLLQARKPPRETKQTQLLEAKGKKGNLTVVAEIEHAEDLKGIYLKREGRDGWALAGRELLVGEPAARIDPITSRQRSPDPATLHTHHPFPGPVHQARRNALVSHPPRPTMR